MRENLRSEAFRTFVISYSMKFVLFFIEETSTLKELLRCCDCHLKCIACIDPIIQLSYLSANKRLVYEEVKKAVERDRSMVKVSELSRHGLMEITRKRVCSFILNALYSFHSLCRSLLKPTWQWLGKNVQLSLVPTVWD